MNPMFLATRIILATGLTLSAASVLAEGSKPSTIEKIQTKVYELLDKDMNAIKFAKDSDALSDSERQSIRAFVTAAKSNGKVDKFIVATWSDQRPKE